MNIRLLFVLFIISITGLSEAVAQKQKTFTLTIQISDSENYQKLIGATIVFKDGPTLRWCTSDEKGIATLTELSGETQVDISYIGYLPTQRLVNVTKDTYIKVSLKPDDKILDEVVVTATESKGITSASKIDSDAMRHLQPSSFTDLLSLLPGGITADPDMGHVNSIRLREAKSGNKDFEFSSLGTSFVVDGVPLSNDANLQSLEGSKMGGRFNSSKGIDMRSISTDNIESVEVIRGIPSVQYGDVSMGVVKIKRKSEESPIHFRFKADQYSKLFYVGKGIGFRNNNVLNLDIDYLDSKVDPRNRYENFKRLTTSVRYNQLFYLPNKALFKWQSSIDLGSTFDNLKSDPEMDEKLDKYKVQEINLAFNNEFKYITNHIQGLRNITFTSSINSQFNTIKQTKEIYLNTPKATPNSTEEGSFDATYLPMYYLSHAKVDGKPFNAFFKMDSEWTLDIKGLKQLINWGIDYRYEKNYGRGKIYDPALPPSTSIATRPRKFNDIPGMQKASFYLEDNISLNYSKEKMIEIQTGLRGIAMVNMDNKFAINNKIHLDPRFNIMIDIINHEVKNSQLQWRIGGGWGILTKLPTLEYLYPNLVYTDIEELNYFHNNPEYRRLVLRTHIYDPTNHELKANRNHKWEVRTDFSWKRYSLALTFFNERTTDGFRTLTSPRKLEYRKYDASGLTGAEVNSAPILENLPYKDETVLTTAAFAGNGSDLKKQGIEFQISTPRYKAINTRLTLFGAWFKTSFNNSQPQWYKASVRMNNSDIPYLGLYNLKEKRVAQDFNTSLMIDTHIPSLGLTFSTTIQAEWFSRSQVAAKNRAPESYMGLDGVVHPYTEVEAEDPMLKQLMMKSSSNTDSRIPFESTINFKANKSFGKYISIALFVNKLINYTPSYTVNGVTIYRSVSPYFGMELNIKI